MLWYVLTFLGGMLFMGVLMVLVWWFWLGSAIGRLLAEARMDDEDESDEEVEQTTWSPSINAVIVRDGDVLMVPEGLSFADVPFTVRRVLNIYGSRVFHCSMPMDHGATMCTLTAFGDAHHGWQWGFRSELYKSGTDLREFFEGSLAIGGVYRAAR